LDAGKKDYGVTGSTTYLHITFTRSKKKKNMSIAEKYLEQNNKSYQLVNVK